MFAAAEIPRLSARWVRMCVSPGARIPAVIAVGQPEPRSALEESDVERIHRGDARHHVADQIVKAVMVVTSHIDDLAVCIVQYGRNVRAQIERSRRHSVPPGLAAFSSLQNASRDLDTPTCGVPGPRRRW